MRSGPRYGKLQGMGKQSVTPVGYTPTQAERLINRIDVQAAKACDALAAMYAIVPDHASGQLAYLQDEIMMRARQLQDVPRRRTR